MMQDDPDFIRHFPPNNMENDNRSISSGRRDSDSVSVPTPWGALNIAGGNVITILLVCALIAIGYFLLKEQNDLNKAMIVELTEMKFILLLPEAKRQKIADYINMPDSLRKALRNNE